MLVMFESEVQSEPLKSDRILNHYFFRPQWFFHLINTFGHKTIVWGFDHYRCFRLWFSAFRKMHLYYTCINKIGWRPKVFQFDLHTITREIYVKNPEIKHTYVISKIRQWTLNLNMSKLLGQLNNFMYARTNKGISYSMIYFNRRFENFTRSFKSTAGT